jgi:hypothetical protein
VLEVTVDTPAGTTVPMVTANAARDVVGTRVLRSGTRGIGGLVEKGTIRSASTSSWLAVEIADSELRHCRAKVLGA